MQLGLMLGDERTLIPWEGVSPRELTKGRSSLFFRREPQNDDGFFVDPEQYDLFHAAIEGRYRYGGAPLLLPLPARRRVVFR